MRKQIDGDPSSEAAEARKTAREFETKGITITDSPNTESVVINVKVKPKKKLIDKIFPRKKNKKKKRR